MLSPFAGTHFVAGLGWVEPPRAGTGALHGEADVMMISGVGEHGLSDGGQGSTPSGSVSTRSDTGQVISTNGAFSLGAALTQRVSVFGITLPAYVWALIALGALGAGYVFFRKMKW